MVLLPLIVFALFVFALVDIILRRDDQVKHLPKLAWVFVVILLPLVGGILWFALGREYEGGSAPRRTLRMPAADDRYRADPSARPGGAPHPGSTHPGSTEAQLAALEREIEAADRELRLRRLEEELRRRDDAGEPA